MGPLERLETEPAALMSRQAQLVRYPGRGPFVAEPRQRVSVGTSRAEVRAVRL